MSAKLGYTAQEWETLRKLPLDAAMSVVVSGKTGPLQVIREARALSDAIRAATRGPSPLVAEIASELSGSRNLLSTGGDDEDILPREARRRTLADALEGVRLARAILAAKATRSDASAYRLWVLSLGRAVAEAAAEEGGFLGFGGTRVAEEERAALDELEAALGLAE